MSCQRGDKLLDVDAAGQEENVPRMRWQWFLVWAAAGCFWGVSALTLASSAFLWVPVAFLLTLQAASWARRWREFLGLPVGLAALAAACVAMWGV